MASFPASVAYCILADPEQEFLVCDSLPQQQYFV